MTDRPPEATDWGRLTCREFVELVTDYVERALSPAAHDEFEHHLTVCEGCRIYLDQIRDTIALTSRAFEDPVRQDALQSAVVAALQAEFRRATRGEG